MIRVFISCTVHDAIVWGTMKDALIAAGCEVMRVDVSEDVGDYQADVLGAIKRCDVFVAVISGLRPNIMLELGYALGCGKTIVLLRAPDGVIPHDFKTFTTFDINVFDSDSIAQIVQWVIDQGKPVNREDILRGTPNEVLCRLLENLDRLDEVSPSEFESLIEAWFSSIGVGVVPVQNAPDKGFDYLLFGLDDWPTVAIEVRKRNRNSLISFNEVHRLVGAAVAADASCAILITSGQFTHSAVSVANRAPIKTVLLTLDSVAHIRDKGAFEGLLS